MFVGTKMNYVGIISVGQGMIGFVLKRNSRYVILKIDLKNVVDIVTDKGEDIFMDITRESRIAVLSDIHGNHIALEKCIQFALDKGVKQFIFLGDYVGELAYPQRTMQILYSLQQDYRCYFIKGNKEDYWINYELSEEQGWKQYDSTTGSMFYTYYQLTDRDKEFFRKLDISDKICIDGFPNIRICHGSPYKVGEKMLNNNERTFEIIDTCEENIILCGHTHVQDKIEYNGKIVLNPGAVGVSLHGDGKAQFLLLESSEGTWDYEFVSLDYDVEQAIEELTVSGLMDYAPSWSLVTKHLLLTGEISHGSVLGRAMF